MAHESFPISPIRIRSNSKKKGAKAAIILTIGMILILYSLINLMIYLSISHQAEEAQRQLQEALHEISNITLSQSAIPPIITLLIICQIVIFAFLGSALVFFSIALWRKEV